MNTMMKKLLSSLEVEGDWISAKRIAVCDLVKIGELWEVSHFDSDDCCERLFMVICHKSISQSKGDNNYFIDLCNGREETLNSENDYQECKMRPVENIERYANLPKVDWR